MTENTSHLLFMLLFLAISTVLYAFGLEVASGVMLACSVARMNDFMDGNKRKPKIDDRTDA